MIFSDGGFRLSGTFNLFKMRIVLLLAFLAFIFDAPVFAQSTVTSPTREYHQNSPYPSIVQIPTYTDNELINRIKGMQSDVVRPRFNKIVRSYINTYTIKNRPKAEAMLGRTVMYFPLFDKYLKESGLPKDLKYLSIVESALDPTAVSRSGAVGLWQFMPATGKEYGLKVSSSMDQRRDPHMSTKAAFVYLKRLYQRFGSWELALAAYNGGPGRVNRAVRRGGSHDFWKIRKYLPVETRNYVPAFIAACYMMHYYDTHNLYPRYPEKELQMTDNTLVYRQISFREISDVTGTSERIIQRLNPSYLHKVVPSRMNGCSVILPLAALAIFENFLGKPDRRPQGMVSSSIPAPTSPEFRSDYIKTSYEVKPGDYLSALAGTFGCTEKDIVEWNNLKSVRLQPQQRLIFYLPNRRDKHLLTPVPAIPKKQIRLLESVLVPLETKEIEPVSFTPRNRHFSKPKKKEKYVYYQVRRRETLAEIASKFPGISPKDIMRINHFRDGQGLKPGKRIKIKPK